mgnify:CR=1 FL=1|tara:strand:- start:214 stop:789 length:576 start_codon:yes stop_codon:yes gene_type:complete
MKDFIGEYPKSVPDDLCDALINAFNNQHVFRLERKASQRKDTQVYLETAYPDMAKNLMNFVGGKLMEYNEVECSSFFTESTFISSSSLMQKTEPMEGYHTWHTENTTWDVYNRALAWMVYLNDVEEGGETEFFYQQTKFKPKKGTTLIWPGGFTHMHRGNPPMSTKYIVTGWFQFDGGAFNDHIFRRQQSQ